MNDQVPLLTGIHNIKPNHERWNLSINQWFHFRDFFCKHFIYITETQGKIERYNIISSLKYLRGGSTNAAIYTFYIQTSSDSPFDTGGGCKSTTKRSLISEWILKLSPLGRCIQQVIVNTAYRTLSDDDQRTAYDAWRQFGRFGSGQQVRAYAYVPKMP